MPDADEPIPLIACPQCGNLFRWKSGLAGRKLKCHCGVVMRMPADPAGEATLEQPAAPPPEVEGAEPPANHPEPAAASHDPYELELPESDEHLAAIPEPAPAPVAPIQHHGRCPSCGSAIKSDAVICLNCGLHLVHGKNIETQVKEEVELEGPPPAPTGLTDTQAARIGTMVAQVVRERQRQDLLEHRAERRFRFREFYAPLILLAAGVVALLVGGVLLTHSFLEGMLTAAALLAMELFIMMPLLLLAVFIAARIGGIAFGSLGTAILKLAAICIGPGTIADLLMIPVMMILASTFAGMFVVFGVYFFFLGLPMSKLFDLDMHETSITVAIAVMIRGIAFVVGFSVIWAILNP